MPVPAGVQLKVRFNTVDQLQNHLHVVDRRTLFFARGTSDALPVGTPVLVQFLIANTDQVSTQRGVAIGHADGDAAHAGAWIEFRDTRLPKKVGQGLRDRSHPRLGCDLLVEIADRVEPVVARVLDVSLAAMHLSGAPGLQRGARVGLRIIGAGPTVPAELGQGEVVRADAGGADVAVRFVREDQASRIAATRLLQAVRETWTQARELTHPPVCCRDGSLLEPAVPHVKRSLQ